MNTEIPIFFTIDDGYVPFLAAALNSAIKNSSPERRYRAIVLHENISEDHIRRLSALARENFKIDFMPMGDGLESITDRMSNRLRCDYFTLTIFFRLFIPALFPQYDKGIYIDSDVVVPGDLAEMFDIDLGDCLIGACNDSSVVDVPPIINYMENAVGVDRYEYINSGVLLLNMAALRERELDKRFLSLLNRYHVDCIAPDQDYLNAMCNGRIRYLPGCWDTMPNDNAPPRSDAKLIHYNLFSKPWCYDGIQYSDVFWHYAEDCGYIDEIREYKRAYSDGQKESDRSCFELLLRRADEIPQTDTTFKKLYESGVPIRL